MASDIQAVLFDYGMVLSGPPNGAAWARMRSATALEEEPLHREYWAHRHEYDRGTYTGEAFWRKVASGAGIEVLTADQVTELIDADTDLWTDPNESMVEWAKRLQRVGVRTGILSNLGDAMQTGVLRKFKWLAGFDHHTWSHNLKIAKPEPEIYRYAAEGLKTEPAAILFVDDKPENIEAAHSAGMQALQYQDHESFRQNISRPEYKHLIERAPLP